MIIKKYFSWKIALLGLFGLCVGAGGAYLWQARQASLVEVAMAPIPADVLVLPSVEEVFPYVLSANSSLSTALRELGVSSQVIHKIVEAAKPVSDLARLSAGTRFQLTFAPASPTDLIAVRFRFSAAELLDVKKDGDQWTAQKINETVETKIMTFSGTVNSSLWESAVQAKMDPNLISELAEVFAWQIDFTREVQLDDRWRISVEQRLVKGQPIGWGPILAAEYENGDQKYSGVLFQLSDQERGYYAPDGTSLKKMFLKSPLKYARISSRFATKRFHPILRISRAHLGVDYAAAVGTPVRAVGDGVIADAGLRGGAGRMIRLRHNATYTSAYKHLSGFAKGIRSGSRVRQGQVIGYVGTSGLSTGPHLHFEFFQAGRFVDPLGRKFPSADPVPAQMFSQFQLESKNRLASLPSWSLDSGRTGQNQKFE